MDQSRAVSAKPMYPHPGTTFSVTITIFSILGALPPSLQDASVAQARSLYNDVILAEDARIKPKLNQSSPVQVSISASILSLLEVDEVQQSISTNLLITLTWTDEIRRWVPGDYGGLKSVEVTLGDMWIPRLLTSNSISTRDTFGTDLAHLSITFQGKALHLPGGVLRTSCILDMTRFPFDNQTCTILLMSAFSLDALEFVPLSKRIELGSFSESPEWDIISTSMIVSSVTVSSLATFEIHLQRKPGHYILNILVPVNIISALSPLVFLTPLGSGERVSFSTTILLSLSVYTSEVSKQLPFNSETIPLMLMYLSCLLLHSGFAIVANILVLVRHHKTADAEHQLHMSCEETCKSGLYQHQKQSYRGDDSRRDEFVSISDSHFDDRGRQKTIWEAGNVSNTGVLGQDATKHLSDSKMAIHQTRTASWAYLFKDCTRLLNFSETNFRASADLDDKSRARGGGDDDQMVKCSTGWRRLIAWLLHYVDGVDLVLCLVFQLAWLVIVVLFTVMISQGN